MTNDDNKVEKPKAVDKKPAEPKKPDRYNTGEARAFQINGVKIQS